jgi:phage shock protein A
LACLLLNGIGKEQTNGGGIMGIFTRFRDIISSNINAMLDKAEDPEKLIRLMIQEMEDTLVEIRATCADAMATKKRVQRSQEEAVDRAKAWADRAQLAVDKGREDLAREALMEKRSFQERAESLERELSQCDDLIEQYQADIVQLENKLCSAREKQRVLVQRHTHARNRKRAQMDIRRVETSDAFLRFEHFENRIERMEAEADLVNFGRKPTLQDEIESLQTDEEIEKELENLKAAGKKSEETPSA